MIFKSSPLSTTVHVVVVLFYCFVITCANLESSGDCGPNACDDEPLEYYILPSHQLEQSFEIMPSCRNLTLEEFASNTDQCLRMNTTLKLLPGTHHLNSELTVANVSQFSMISDENLMQDVTINCTEKISFINVLELNIRSVKFVGCTGNHIESVTNVILNNCIFDGLGHNGSALNIIETTFVSITSCLFFDIQGAYRQESYYWSAPRYYLNYTVGGAIVSAHSYINIQNSTFDRNTAHFGGAIFADQNSTLTLIECRFKNNGLLTFSQNYNFECGKNYNPDYSCSILEMDQSVLSIQGCTFDSQNISKYFMIKSLDSSVTVNDTDFKQINTTGLIIYDRSDISILDCTFQNNVASGRLIRGSDSNVIVKGTEFKQNNAYGLIRSCCSGISCKSRFEIRNCNFIKNNVQFYGLYIYGPVQAEILYTNFTNTVAVTKHLDARYALGTIFAWNCILYFKNCMFIGNSALQGAAFYALNSTTQVDETYISKNTAHAFGVILIYNGNLTTDGIYIVGNTAGTGVVILTSCMASFTGDTTFNNNVGSFSTGLSTVEFKGNITVRRNRPSSNKALLVGEDGAIFSVQSLVQIVGELLMTDNYADNGGAIHSSQSTFSMNGNITIANNTASEFGGGIYLIQSYFGIQGKCSISNNRAKNGGGVYAFSSTISLKDALYSPSSLTMMSNKAKESGGALYLSTNSKIYSVLISSLVHHINFIENTANEYGGALYIDDKTNPDLCNGSPDECFFIILWGMVIDIDLEANTLNFTKNTAVIKGKAIFGGLLDRCTGSPLKNTRFRGQENLLDGVNFIKSVSNIDDIDLISSLPVRICFCKDGQHNCSLNQSPMYVTKRQDFILSVVAVNQVGQPLKSDVEASLMSKNGTLGEGQKLQNVNSFCTNLTYNIITPNETEVLLLNAVGPCNSSIESQRRIEIVFENCSCPVGFQPASTFQRDCKCMCHSNLTKYNDIVLVSNQSCYQSSGTFTADTNTWISYIIEPSNDYYLLVHSHCPFDYCKKEPVNISLSQPNGSNALCNFKRAGTLCGACQPGFSLSFGSSRCMKCGEHWEGALVGLLLLQIIAGIAIVCVLLFLNMTVAIGTLNGILFYANIVYGNASVYFNNLPSSSFPSTFIAWLNLDTGFDICLFEGIDTFAKTLLQLVFPIYLIILVVAVIIISKYSQRFSNLIGKKDPIATLATLILLSYAKILSTVITMLSLTTLEYPEGSRILWKPDATIEYLKDPKHVILFLVAMVILLLGTTYTLILISWQLLIRFSNCKVFAWIRNPKFSSFIGAYHVPFTSKHRYWTGLLLLLRVILFLVSAFESTQVALLTITLAIICLLVMIGRNIYRKAYLNFVEILSLLNILAFTVFTWYATDTSTDNKMLQKFVAHISVTICCILLILVIVIHVCKYTKANAIIKKTKFYSKLHNNDLIPKKKKTPAKHTVDLQLTNCDRDVNIFELVNTNDNTYTRSQVPTPAVAKGVSHSTIEIPKLKEDQSQGNEGTCKVTEA